ncbi:hypothetical protein FIBSPDRAFT_870342 [Athelia psychrophila]|uniref:Uncharacterized protein n=1 Tax=Athelia psychrophila TaxID=1759441 RepID=A0A166B5A2_9AGAM|nr:hypothetical protein FIBSPDRAFT_870342 [Fibularhizoctonia sp. CBS 109695]
MYCIASQRSVGKTGQRRTYIFTSYSRHQRRACSIETEKQLTAVSDAAIRLV